MRAGSSWPMALWAPCSTAGVFINRCFDELNLSAPDLVREVHQDTSKPARKFSKPIPSARNRMHLAAFGFAEKLKAINQAGVRLAREAAATGL